MKRTVLWGSVLAIILYSSCNTMVQIPEFTNEESSTSLKKTMVQTPEFTNAQSLTNLKIGTTLEATISQLGCKPYNVLSKQADGYEIYVYKYKQVERKIDSKDVNRNGFETGGEVVYNGKMSNVILIYKDNKLVSLLTDEGKNNSSQIVLLDNTLYKITSNKGEYTIMLDTTEKNENQ